MVLFNHSTRELTAKIVYYGAGLCGKTTNLTQLHERLEKGTAGRLLSLATAQDRTIYFDLLPVELGNIKGYTVRFQLCTVPGQVYYNETRKLVLRGVDGIVFVVDSQWSMLSHNLESYQNLRENLAEADIVLDSLPLVVQYNKRDLPGVLSVDALQESLGFQSYPYVEAIASAGKGVVETFKLVSKLTFVDLLRRLQRIPGPETEARTAENADETAVRTSRSKPSSYSEPVSVGAAPPSSSGLAEAAAAPPAPAPATMAPPTPAPVRRPPASPSPDDSWRRLFARVERAGAPVARSAPAVPAAPEPAPVPEPPAPAPEHPRLPTAAEPFELGSGVYKTPLDMSEVFGDFETATPAAMPPNTEPTFERREDVFEPADMAATRELRLPPPAAAPHAPPPPAPSVAPAELTALRDELKDELARLASELASARSAIASEAASAREEASAQVAALRDEITGTLDAALQSRVMDELQRLRAQVGDGDAAVRQEHETARRQLLEAHGELAARIVPREDLDAARHDAELAAASLREELASLTTNVRHEIALVREELRAETRRLDAAVAASREELQALRAELDRRSREVSEVVESSHGKLVSEIASARQDARREIERIEAALADARRHADERVSRIAASFRRVVEELGPGD